MNKKREPGAHEKKNNKKKKQAEKKQTMNKGYFPHARDTNFCKSPYSSKAKN